MKKSLITSGTIWILTFATVGILSAQKRVVEDDIYYDPSDRKAIIEKKKAEKLNEQKVQRTLILSSQGTRNGLRNERNVDEYNRRFSTAVDSLVQNQEEDQVTYQVENDAERGGYVNQFNGNESDYEYAERIRRFHDPRFRIHISSPAFNDIYMLNSSDWNVYVDDFDAYVTPTFTNPFYWNYQWAPFSYNPWAWQIYPRFGWSSSFYNGYYNPYNSWGCGWGWDMGYNPYWGFGGSYYPGYYPSYGWGNVVSNKYGNVNGRRTTNATGGGRGTSNGYNNSSSDYRGNGRVSNATSSSRQNSSTVTTRPSNNSSGNAGNSSSRGDIIGRTRIVNTPSSSSSDNRNSYNNERRSSSSSYNNNNSNSNSYNNSSSGGRSSSGSYGGGSSSGSGGGGGRRGR